MNKSVVGIIIAVIVVGGGIFILVSNKNDKTNTTSNTTTPATSSSQNNTTENNTTSSQSSESSSVAIQDFAFSPGSITVKKGTTVTWTNQDSASHTVTGDNGGPSSGTLAKGGTYSFKFDTVGTFAYHCNFHSNMTATVEVTE